MDKKTTSSRRNFIKNTGTGALLLGLGAESLSGLLSSCHSTKIAVASQLKTSYEQTPLPYAYHDLENVIDAQTMEIHYSKHAAGYAKNLSDAMVAEKITRAESLESLLGKVSAYSTKLRNNAGGHYNHELFWKCMRPKKSDNIPAGKILLAIETQFGSFAQFKSLFSDAGKARFGSGWVWLVKNDKGSLEICSTANQDNPLMDIKSNTKGIPLLCLDVWEHAYYLKYQQKRADYIDNWWSLVNWDYVSQRLENT